MKQRLNPFVFSGRIGRLGYACTTIVLAIAGVVPALVSTNLFYTNFFSYNSEGRLIVGTSLLLVVVITILGIGCGVKRLRDLRVTPWLVVLSLIPFINIFFWINLALRESAEDSPQE